MGIPIKPFFATDYMGVIEAMRFGKVDFEPSSDFQLLPIREMEMTKELAKIKLVVHTTGTLAKLFSEAAEAIDPRSVEGIRATGANRLHEIVYGVFPQVLPLWISYSLYRFEANVRSATVLGIVGAGGVGMALSEALRSFDYAAASAMLLTLRMAT